MVVRAPFPLFPSAVAKKAFELTICDRGAGGCYRHGKTMTTMTTTTMNHHHHARHGEKASPQLPAVVVLFFDGFLSYCWCRRGRLSAMHGRPQQQRNNSNNNNAFFAFLAGAVIALVATTVAHLYLYSSSAASTAAWTSSSRGSIYDTVPKQQAASSVDFAGEIVTKEPDEACRLELQTHQAILNTEETAVICAIAKYEEQYLDEWVDYHLALGFAHILIYDNTADFELKEWARKKSCRVSVRHFPGASAPQAKAYLNCARHLSSSASAGQHQHEQNHTWIAFFDIDEFLILIDPKYQNTSNDHDGHDGKNMSSSRGGVVVPFLRDHCPPGIALGINWRVMGTAGHTLYQPAPMTLRFQYAVDSGANPHVKSIIHLNDLNLDRLSHVHYPRFKQRYTNESNNDTSTTATRQQQQRDTSSRVFSGHFNADGPSDVALLYHYG
jgi:Glycosyl transferase family 2